jgi:hypothetical protein
MWPATTLLSHINFSNIIRTYFTRVWLNSIASQLHVYIHTKLLRSSYLFRDMRSKERQCETYLVDSVREMFVLGAYGLRVLDGLAPLCGGGLTSCL